MPKSDGPVSWAKYELRQLKSTRKSKPPKSDLQQLVYALEFSKESDPFHRADIALLALLWYGETFLASIISDDKRQAHTWQNALWVGRAIPPDDISIDESGKPFWSEGTKTRRREELRFAHHEKVAPLKPAQQVKYLQIAIDQGLNHIALKELIDKEVRGIVKLFSDDLAKLQRRAAKLHSKIPTSDQDQENTKAAWKSCDDNMTDAINQLLNALDWAKLAEQAELQKERMNTHAETKAHLIPDSIAVAQVDV